MQTKTRESIEVEEILNNIKRGEMHSFYIPAQSNKNFKLKELIRVLLKDDSKVLFFSSEMMQQELEDKFYCKKPHLEQLILKSFSPMETKIEEIKNYINLLKRDTDFTTNVVIFDHIDVFKKESFKEEIKKMAEENNFVLIVCEQSKRYSE